MQCKVVFAVFQYVFGVFDCGITVICNSILYTGIVLSTLKKPNPSFCFTESTVLVYMLACVVDCGPLREITRSNVQAHAVVFLTAAARWLMRLFQTMQHHRNM